MSSSSFSTMKVLIALSLAFNVIVVVGGSAVFWKMGGVDYLRAKYVEHFVDSPYAAPGSPYYESTYYQAFSSQFDRLPVDSTSILFAGDSHVERGRWEEYLQTPILNRGISGESATDLLWRAPSLTRGSPATIILLTGANDAANRGKNATEILETYDALLTVLRSESPSTRLLVLTIPRFGGGLPGNQAVNDIINAVNDGLPALVDKHNATLVDAATALEGPNGEPLHYDYTRDHLHLNGAGYQVVADQLRPHLTKDGAATNAK